MPDRRRRAALRLPLSDFGAGERGSLLPRDRQSPSSPSSPQQSPSSPQQSAGSSDSPGPRSGESGSPQDDNPFAPPPEGAPDRPWRPRRPARGGSEGTRPTGDSEGQDGERPASPWGSQWSRNQPQRGSGGFGSGRRDTGGSGQGGGRPEGGPGGMRWDPTDPAQRRARYALLSGMWAFFFALFDMPEIALLLGALALYWSISSLRAPRRPAGGTNPPGGQADPYSSTSRPQTSAAISGLVTAGLALVLVAASFTLKLVYQDFYTCVNDSLTKTAQLDCNDRLPEGPLRELYGVQK
ncbi:hypothetical protein [Streptomyces sp. GC420]|uniref:hypothetical protein n=1 Tax=Streptomyces sp. GC420 TaxID=2697568 RepID=UPI001414E729|nr:hypothetical protein [Streptomyces sp. GC420]NBM19562.1 hypothetical protein [Streptomyces sp. GC420]